MEMTRRGWIQGIVASVAAAAVVVRATPAETALVKVGAPADLLVAQPEPVVLNDVLPTLYVKTRDGHFEPFAECTDLSMSIQRHELTSFASPNRTYVNALPSIEGRFVVIGGISYAIDNEGKRHWGRRSSR